MAAILADHES